MREGPRDHCGTWRPWAAGWLVIAAGIAAAVEPVPLRHPLEARALTQPESVLSALPAEIDQAKERGDLATVALLYLSQANACRVVANWTCQRDAGLAAREAANAASQPLLSVRGLIAESRGRIALQDFITGEHLLADAETLLRANPHPELLADVYLAYSSLSYSLGKHKTAAEYAERGLNAIATRTAPAMQARLLRNRARAQAQLGQTAQAEQTLQEALPIAEHVDDPKLNAEIALELARIAHLRGDIPTQREQGRRVLELAQMLRNTQLNGQGHEVLGIAARAAGDGATALAELRTAHASFHQLNMGRDELRVLRELVQTSIDQSVPLAELKSLMTHYLQLQSTVDQTERAKAADDFEARLRYIEQDMDLMRLRSEADLARQREEALIERQRFVLIGSLLSLMLVLVLAATYLLQRRSNRRLRSALTRLGESESRYRILADNSRDLVVRMRLDGQRLYISPSAQDMLGWKPSELMQPRWELVHPDDVPRLTQTLSALAADGGSATVSYRVRHKNGDYIWIEAIAQVLPSPSGDGTREIIYSGRDISKRVVAEEARDRSEARLRAVSDNIPALISHLDADERYTFANAFIERLFGIRPEAIVGRTLREVIGETTYADIKPHVDAALQGEPQLFDGSATIRGRLFHYQSSYVPDVGVDGAVRGFFSLTFDITPLKRAEQELERLARFDALTGIANRRYFEERLTIAIARAQRHAMDLALLYLDIDRFKAINDSRGHLTGDAVIREFAIRLQSCLRTDDLVARLGGDEFVVLIENPSSADDIESVAKKIVCAMRVPLVIDGSSLQVTTSVGIAYLHAPESAETLLAVADKALYAAKDAGRNDYRLLGQS
ncbi:diguanylate cyclase domain-containing protein [Tahibacter amnicola]|uniref:Diguanylate cyclase n=1 Tax=Tahibacter amnicola TaxID=2976241 RepID=A0ABY6BF63_9GAMM|nr:diguanylate cyclase [Tahibacter amnicola]UXI67745.1 diguanylate cyclase [Tahibacter amnicola]